jgi:ferredoxin-NADP reductase
MRSLWATLGYGILLTDMVHADVHIQITVLRTSLSENGCMSVYFARPIGFEYEAGDWIDVNFPDRQLDGGITYSLSSSPTEDELAITFKLGISPFKKALQALRPGDEMYISQYGNDYNFYLKENRSSVLLAGGIGIAPFRSMIKDIFDTKSRNDIQLLYMNKGESFVFAEELDFWNRQLPNLKISYINTEKLNRKKREKLLLSTVSKSAHHYFIAGPEGMVESTEHLLIDNGIDVKDIRIDSFGGY